MLAQHVLDLPEATGWARQTLVLSIQLRFYQDLDEDQEPHQVEESS